MRVIVLIADPTGEPKLDAQIRVGGDAGASEVIVLRLYGPLAEHGDSVVVPLLLPDAPVVAWWPGDARRPPAEDPIGRMAQRRITDAASAAGSARRPARAQRARTYQPGDTDLAWTRLTLWRAQLAAVLDQPPYEPVTAVEVHGRGDSPSTDLLAAWLQPCNCSARRLREVRTRRRAAGSSGIHRATGRASGPVDLVSASTANDGRR